MATRMLFDGNVSAFAARSGKDPNAAAPATAVAPLSRLRRETLLNTSDIEETLLNMDQAPGSLAPGRTIANTRVDNSVYRRHAPFPWGSHGLNKTRDYGI
jgi:hypothetical protein